MFGIYTLKPCKLCLVNVLRLLKYWKRKCVFKLRVLTRIISWNSRRGMFCPNLRSVLLCQEIPDVFVDLNSLWFVVLTTKGRWYVVLHCYITLLNPLWCIIMIHLELQWGMRRVTLLPRSLHVVCISFMFTFTALISCWKQVSSTTRDFLVSFIFTSNMWPELWLGGQAT